LQAEKSQFTIRIKDDGCGFVPDCVKPGCMGLANMRERAGSLGGDLKISSAPGNGTSVETSMLLDSVSAPLVN